MKLHQKLDLRKLLVPELKQSLKILCLPLPDLASLVNEELENNPFLEESASMPSVRQSRHSITRSSRSTNTSNSDEDFDPFAQLSKTASLQEVLLRQLAASGASEEQILIGQEIIGNIDDDGFLKASVNEIAQTHHVPVGCVEETLKIIQLFDPLGVGARDIQESLIIQCAARNEDNPVIKNIIVNHLDDIAKRKYSVIAKALNITIEDVEQCVKKISNLNPRPGQNYTQEYNHTIIPDIFLDEKDDDVEIFINQDNVPTLYINEEYRQILKNDNIPAATKEYLKEKLQEAMDLLRSISRRQSTLKRVLEVIVSVQKEAILEGLSKLKPLTCKEIAEKIEMHESTVYRVIMNKYAETPQGLIALNTFLTNSIVQESGEVVTSNQCKDRIRELIDNEDKKQPLSDEDLAAVLQKENGIKLARRTVAKYREELKIFSSTLRRER